MNERKTEHFLREAGHTVSDPNQDDKVSLQAKVAQLEAELAKAQRQTSTQAKNLEGLLSISEASRDPASLQEIYERTMDTVLEITGVSAAIIRQHDLHTGAFVMMSSRGLTPEMIEEVALIPSEDGIDGAAARSLWPVVMEDLVHDQRNRSPSSIEAGYCSLICVPLIARRDLIGTMELITNVPYHWSEDEIRWLAAVGRQVGSVIGHIQLTERVRDLAILEERARLSRELHDGMSQMVGALRLRAEEAYNCILDEDIPAAVEEIRRVEEVARDVYVSLREEMIGLRDTNSLDRGLAEIIQDQLNRFHRQWGIETSFHTDTCTHPACRISQQVEVQLLRIVQEALANIRRHASASHVQVVLEASEGCVRVSIHDDGCGFDPDQVAPERLGLRILRERAASLGGHMKLWSRSGKGTLLEVELPKNPGTNLARGLLHEHHLVS